MNELRIEKERTHNILPPPATEELLPAGNEHLLDAGEDMPSQELLEASAREEIKETAETINSSSLPSELNESEDYTYQARRIDNQLQAIVKNREIKHIQSKENFLERHLSQVIHNPVISRISEPASKTISRPSGMLGGGIVAFLGTFLYYFLARRIGFSYNYSLLVLLFVGGFILGLILEIIYALIIGKKRQKI